MSIPHIYPCTTCDSDKAQVFGVYLHGKLEDLAGFDLIQTLINPYEKSSWPELNDSKPALIFPAIFHYGNQEMTVLVYYWLSEDESKLITCTKGLVVDPSDGIANQYALMCYMNRMRFL